jgi:hypothetical protein
MKSLRWLLLPTICTLGCGSTFPYDADYECTQMLSCFEDEEGFVLGPTAVADCTAKSQSDYDALANKQAADAAFSLCKGAEGCAYVDCKAAHYGVDRTYFVYISDEYDSGLACGDEVIAMPGQLETPQGSIPYDSIELGFAVSRDYGCLTHISVSFMMGECFLRLEAYENRDDQGRYVVQQASMQKQGSCPNYPEWLGDSYTPETSGGPVGTIAVNRPLAPWNECVDGSLLIRLHVALLGSPETGVSRLDMTGLVVEVPGPIGQTGRSLGDCPDGS